MADINTLAADAVEAINRLDNTAKQLTSAVKTPTYTAPGVAPTPPAKNNKGIMYFAVAVVMGVILYMWLRKKR